MKTNEKVVRGFDQKAQDDAQKKHAELVERQIAEREAGNTSLITDIKQTTKEHIGKLPEDEHLQEEIAARKVGMVRPKIKLTKIQQMHEGEAVDVIQVPEDDEEFTVPGATPLNEPQRVQAVIDEHRGGKKKGAKKSEESGPSKEAQASSQTRPSNVPIDREADNRKGNKKTKE